MENPIVTDGGVDTTATLKQSEHMPVSFPVITVLGQEYTLRFTVGAGMRMMRRGIDPAKLKPISEEWNAQGRSLDLMFELLAAMLGREVNGKWKPLDLSVEELADQFSLPEMAMLSLAVHEAVKNPPAGKSAGTPPAPDPAVQ